MRQSGRHYLRSHHFITAAAFRVLLSISRTGKEVTTGKKRQVDVFTKHQISIAKRTLKLSDAGAFILGGMTKAGGNRVMAQYMDSGKNQMRPIPKAPWYVLSNDPFFSGWGHAIGKTNTCVVACRNKAEAKGVFQYVKSRGDQEYIRISDCIPEKTCIVISGSGAVGMIEPLDEAEVLYSMPRWKETARRKGYLPEEGNSMRVYSDRFYLMRVHPGISGFTRWDQWEYYVNTGLKARNDKTRIVSEYHPRGAGIFRLEDGHTPEYQPRVTEAEALQWLKSNPYQRVTPIEEVTE